MDERMERLSAVTGLTAVLAVGIPTVFIELLGDGGVVRDPAWLWWTAYLVYLVVFAAEPYVPERWTGLRTDAALIAVQVVTGAVVFALAPEGWSGVILVCTAASAAFVLPRAAVAWVIAGQTVVVATVLASIDWTPGAVVLQAVIYGTFQAFAALVTFGQRAEAEARAELAATHAELRATTALLAASTRTAERLRISRDLHDVVGHQLTGLALELEVASHRAEGPAAEHVARARSIAKDLLRDVRGAVGELRHTPHGLEPALRELVTDLPGLTVHLEVVEEHPLDEARAVAVVRCVQEVVTNTLRHAGARHLSIHVRVDETGVELSTSDDGRGTPALVPGNGLTGLRERVEQLGGQVTVETGSGRTGFALAARVPAP